MRPSMRGAALVLVVVLGAILLLSIAAKKCFTWDGELILGVFPTHGGVTGSLASFVVLSWICFGRLELRTLPGLLLLLLHAPSFPATAAVVVSLTRERPVRSTRLASSRNPFRHPRDISIFSVAALAALPIAGSTLASSLEAPGGSSQSTESFASATAVSSFAKAALCSDSVAPESHSESSTPCAVHLICG